MAAIKPGTASRNSQRIDWLVCVNADRNPHFLPKRCLTANLCCGVWEALT
jgi:hypothetical protein